MSNLQVFKNPDFGEIRTFKEPDGSVTFCGTDAATALGYSNTRDALIRHCKSDGVANHDVIDTLGRKQKAKFISEGNLYRLIAGSQLPGADKFERWIFDEVLPSIRQTGFYGTPATIDAMLSNPDTMIKMLTAYKEEKEGRAAAETKVKELTPKATYCDHMLDNPGLVPISSIAKDFGMSARALNKMLHNYGVQYKQGDQWLLYAKYQDCGYVGSKPVDIVRKDGSPDVKPQTQWTQLGRKFIYDLLKSNGILPIVERPPFIKEKATAKKKRVG